jgi:hypothetical protein
MGYPLDSFEQYIDRTILMRGKSYFESGAVLSMEEIDTGEYEAEVEGADVYEVQVTMQNRIVEAESCSCPYEDDTCKHVVAVLYAIREEIDSNVASPPQASETKAKPKKETLENRLDRVLQGMTLEQVRDVLRNHCLDDENLCRSLFLQYEQDGQTVSKADITAQVSRMLRKAAGRHGYIDYYNAGDAAAMVGEVLAQAEKSLALGRPLDALIIASIVMEEMTDAMEYADDSGGEIGGVVEDALEVIRGIAAMDPLDENARKEAFAYCCRAYQERLFEDWDWHLPMLTLAGEFARSTQEQAAVLNLAEQKPRSEYSIQQQREVAMKLIRKFHGDEAADDYLHAHIEVYSFRKQLIELALAAGDAEHADNLAQEGYLQDKIKSPGYAFNWLKLRLQIAEQQQDGPKAALLARQLFDENHFEKMAFFQAIKRNTPKPQWPSYLEALLAKVQSSSHNQTGLLADIYASERMLDKLLVIVEQVRQPQFTTQYQAILKAKHSAQLVQVWKSILQNHYRHCTDRKSYATACDYLKQIKALGGADVASKLAADIRVEFGKRPAFLDELRRAGF